MRTRSRVAALMTSLGVAVALAGCGGQAEETPESPDATTQPVVPMDPDDGTEDATGATVATAEVDLGTILVNGDGMTLYLFTNDSPGVSVCEGDCLAAWPPLLGEPVAGEGVDAGLLGTLERSDGAIQVSYDGWPLYTWTQDSAPGDTTGQGFMGVWWVVSPEGEAIGAPG